MRDFFITALQQLTIPDAIPGRGVRFGDHFFLTNDPDVVRPLLTADLRDHIGGVEFDFLRSSRAVVYAWLPDDLRLHDNYAAVTAVTNALRAVDTFLLGLWRHKDHAITFDQGFLHFRPGAPHVVTTASNSILRRPTTATGGYDTITFAFSELRSVQIEFEGYLPKQHLTADHMLSSTREYRIRRASDRRLQRHVRPTRFSGSLVRLEEVVSGNLSEGKRRPECGTLDGAMTRDGHGGPSTVRVLSSQRDVRAGTYDVEAE